MNWTKTSAIAEIVSSAAILVTLLYLAVQTRQTTEAIQASGRQASQAQTMELLLSQMENPSMWAIQHRTEYTDEEKVYFNSWLVAFFAMRQTDWTSYQNGALDEASWLQAEGAIRQVFKTPLFRVWWRNFSPSIESGFAARVNQILAEGPASSDNNILVMWE